jgi:hypothetical protein
MLIRSDTIKLVVFSLSAVIYFPFSEWMSTARIGTAVFLWGQAIYLLAFLGVCLAAPILIVGPALRRWRRQSLYFLAISVIFATSFLLGMKFGQQVRSIGLHSFTRRSQRLIDAITSYERDHATPPQSLSDLVPDYLNEVLDTGMMAYPEYLYFAGDEAKQHYSENPWALVVWTPSGGINFDQMLYFPRQNYPAHGYGGWLERINDWAYVHE